MDIVRLVLVIIGTVAFAISGAILGVQKKMDVFGVAVLGITTAVGGGILRDVLLGITPAAALRDPIYVAIALVTSVMAFLPPVRRFLTGDHPYVEKLLLWADSAGLAIFTVNGIQVAYQHGFGENHFLVLFVAVLTGVGGGVIRDMFCGERPYIFVKHIYACASIAGAVICIVLWQPLGEGAATLCGAVIVFLIRLFRRISAGVCPRRKGGKRIAYCLLPPPSGR